MDMNSNNKQLQQAEKTQFFYGKTMFFLGFIGFILFDLLSIYGRGSEGGAKAPPQISRDVPSLRRSVAATFRRSDVVTFRQS